MNTQKDEYWASITCDAFLVILYSSLIGAGFYPHNGFVGLVSFLCLWFMVCLVASRFVISLAKASEISKLSSDKKKSLVSANQLKLKQASDKMLRFYFTSFTLLGAAVWAGDYLGGIFFVAFSLAARFQGFSNLKNATDVSVD